MKVRLFLENYEMPFQSIQVATGVGFLTAQITLPPGEHRRKILPGTRVNAFMSCAETNWEWVWWFRGFTPNFPEQAIGLDSNPVVLMVESELSVLKSAVMTFLTLGEERIEDIKEKSTTFDGKVKLFRASAMDFFFPFYKISDKNITFGHRILGMMQSLLSLNPQVWERARQSRCLDYLAIETNDDISEKLDKALVMGGLVNVLGQIQSPSFSAANVLEFILQYIFHDICSFAPMKLEDTGLFKSPKRDTYGYMPADVFWWNMPAIAGSGSLADAFCAMDNRKVKIFDHMIKPAFESKRSLERNVITLEDYQTAYVVEAGATRSVLRVPVGVDTRPIMVLEELAPAQIADAYQLVRDLATVAKDRSTVVARSNLIADRATGLRTNEERMLNKVISNSSTGDQRLVGVLYGIGSEAKDKTNAEKRALQQEYLRQYAFFEHEGTKGVDLRIPNAKYNPDVTAGFNVDVHGRDGQRYTGKLVQKIDTYNLQTETCTSDYTIQNCMQVDYTDFNRIKPNADFLSIETTFETSSSSTDKTSHPVLDIPVSTALSVDNARFCGYYQALAHLGLAETQEPTVLEAETMKVFPVNGNKRPYQEEVDLTERFYAALDMLPGAAEVYISGKRPANMLIDEEAWNTLFEHYNRLGLSPTETVGILNGKNVNVFTFASILVNSVLPTERVSVTEELFEMKNDTIYTLPIWEGNPFPQRTDLLVYYLSKMDKNSWVDFLEKGKVPTLSQAHEDRRPISDRQIIELRRVVVEKAYGER